MKNVIRALCVLAMVITFGVGIAYSQEQPAAVGKVLEVLKLYGKDRKLQTQEGKSFTIREIECQYKETDKTIIVYLAWDKEDIVLASLLIKDTYASAVIYSIKEKAAAVVGDSGDISQCSLETVESFFSAALKVVEEQCLGTKT